MVIDTLNKYNQEEDAVVIICILSKTNKVTSVSLRFFITSRPKLPIRNGFSEI